MRKRSWKIERVVAALFLTALVVRTASVYYTYMNFREGENMAASTRQVHQVIDALYRIQYGTVQVENIAGRYNAPHATDSSRAYDARLLNVSVKKLNADVQVLSDSTRNNPLERHKMDELGSKVSTLEKSLASITGALPVTGDRIQVSVDAKAVPSLVNDIVTQADDIIAGESQLMITGRGSVATTRHKLLSETYFAAIVGMIFVFFILFALNRDILRRKKAEAKTRENEHKLRKMIEEVGDVIFSADYMGRFTFINMRLESLTGYTTDELLGKDYNFLVHPDWIANVKEFYQAQFTERIPETRLEFPIVTKQGKTRWVEQNVVLVTNGKMVEGFQCVVRDVSHRKEAEESIKASLEKEKQINELKSRFVSLASHEFRTPLSTILSSTELIREYMEHESQSPAFIKDKKIHHLNRIKSAIQNMVTTLNNFLSLDQLEHGKISTNPEEFDVKKLSEEMIDKVSQKLKPNQKIIYNHTSASSVVYMDKAILGNIIVNLLTNAIKYSPEGSMIRYTTNVRVNGLEFSVEDQGIGIPESEQANLFERFFRAKNTLNIDGTGLGLSIVKKYVDLLNGHISFISRENEGSIFKVFVLNAVTPPENESELKKQRAL